MNDVVNFLVRHSEAFIFVYVFADQIGVPLPAVPALLAMGARAAVGKVNFASRASVERRGCPARGHHLVHAGPDARESRVRRTEDVFLRYGVRSLVIAKFIPGLSTVAPPLAGMVGVGLLRFAVYSALASLLWAGTWGGLGYLAGDALQRITVESGRLGTMLATLVATGVVVYIVVERPGVIRVRPLEGGLPAWRERGVPVEPISPPIVGVTGSS